MPANGHPCPTNIEALQDDLLRQLDELNERIKQTLAEFSPPRPKFAQRERSEHAVEQFESASTP